MGGFFVYRNCFTGDVSGGDMHTGGFCSWVNEQRPGTPIALVHAAGDGQEEAYPETTSLQQLTYADNGARQPVGLLYLRRAQKGSRVPLPEGADTVFLAGSHFLPDVLPVFRNGKRGTRAVYIHHIIQDMPRAQNFNNFLANLQERLCFRLIRKHFDKIITVNHAVVESLRRRGFRQPIMVSSNFVDNGGAGRVAWPDKDITLAFCGRMVKQKGVDEFLRLCETLQRDLPDFRAVMVGVGPELPRLVRLAAVKGLNIAFVGRADDRQKFDIVRRAQLFVLPSIEEGWGIVVAEALSVGTPVLAYDLPVYKDIFGHRLHTVAIHNEQRLRAAARRLLAHYRRRPELYEKEQIELVQFAQRFRRDRIAQEEYDFLLDVPAQEVTA
ncbi:MAG TPA: glycosyltransferase [Candidatus Saccharimonadales bacterium]|nr:glycosyltransferase [Candidatus Saccharimonadales bacterium]